MEDNPSSSANAVALQVLGALYTLTNHETYQHSLEKGLNLLINTNGQYGMYVSALAVAAQWYAHPPLKLEVTGENSALKHVARQFYAPSKLVSYHPEEATAEIRPCVGNRCLAPIKGLDQLHLQLNQLVGSSS